MIGSKMKISSLFYKALFNSLVGAPLSMIVNVLVVPPMASYIHQEPILGSLLLTIPFFIVSTMRQFIIDYFLLKHNVNIDPKHLVGRLIEWLK